MFVSFRWRGTGPSTGSVGHVAGLAWGRRLRHGCVCARVRVYICTLPYLIHACARDVSLSLFVWGDTYRYIHAYVHARTHARTHARARAHTHTHTHKGLASSATLTWTLFLSHFGSRSRLKCALSLSFRTHLCAYALGVCVRSCGSVCNKPHRLSHAQTTPVR